MRLFEEGGGAVEVTKAEKLAQDFHETYERLASKFGYETRRESAKPWAEVPDANRKLMIAVCAELLRRLEHGQGAQAKCLTRAERELEFARKIKMIGERYNWSLSAFFADVKRQRAERHDAAPPEQPQGSGEPKPCLGLASKFVLCGEMYGDERVYCANCRGNQPQKEVMPTDTGQHGGRANNNPASATGASPEVCTCVHGDSDPHCKGLGHPVRKHESAGLADRGEGLTITVTQGGCSMPSSAAWMREPAGFSGSGLATRSEYDIPAALEAFARSQGAAAPSLPSAEELARKMWEQSGAPKHRAAEWGDIVFTERGREYLSWAKAALSALAGDKVSKEVPAK